MRASHACCQGESCSFSSIVSGNVREDMNEIRAFYSGIAGKYPDRFGAIRLKEEM